MRPLLNIVAVEDLNLFLAGSILSAFAIAGVFLIVFFTAAAIYVNVMNRKQQAEAKKRSEKDQSRPIT